MIGISRLKIRQAAPSDTAAIAHILTAAAAWLDETGKWNDWPIPRPLADVVHMIARGTTYVVMSCRELKPIATVTLQWSDERYWGQREPDAGYIHRLAVLPEKMGLSVGDQILHWVTERVRATNRSFVRLDCPAANWHLRNYYEKHGFNYVASYSSDSGYDAALYELAIPKAHLYTTSTAP
jgi:ribosomal protein S18 acetylase RimI-like enzyme